MGNDFESYDLMRRLEAECSALMTECGRLGRKLEEQEAAILDLKAGHFADGIERALDLEAWDGIHAAHVGHDLEEIAAKLMAAMEASGRGEDVGGMLYDISGDVFSLMADISSVREP